MPDIAATFSHTIINGPHITGFWGSNPPLLSLLLALLLLAVSLKS